MLKQANATAKITNATFASSVEAEIFKFFSTLDGFSDFLKKDSKSLDLSPKDREKLQGILRDFFKTKGIILSGDFEIPPTLLAVQVYELIANLTNNFSPYLEIKQKSIAQAKIIKEQFLHILDDLLKNKSNLEIFNFALRISALGNVIDYGAQCEFDLNVESKKILEANFSTFELEAFLERLSLAKSFVFIGDNAGENEFDEILIRAIKEKFKQIELYYFVRGAEIINDVTMCDIKNSNSNLLKLCKVVDSGVLSPGFIKSLASKEALDLFKKADIVLLKGMGNFESLGEVAKDDLRVFFLFKIKCDVVSAHLQKPLGDFMFFSANFKH